jgi:hypothetical protein
MVFGEGKEKYTTQWEIDFIKHMGIFTRSDRFGNQMSRSGLLKRYLKAAKRRSNWDGLDGPAIIKFVEAELARATQGCSKQ